MRGKILKLNLLALLLFTLALFILNLSISTFAVDSTNSNFTVVPDNVFFNWSIADINVTSDENNTVVIVNASATEILPQYFTSSDYPVPGSGWPTQNQWERCFSVTAGAGGMKFRVQNATGWNDNLTYSGILNKTETEFFNISAYQYCPPGYYTGYFYVFKNGTAADKAKLGANVSVPINPQNTFNYTGRYATFLGSFTVNEVDYHSFYINTSQIENSSSGTIKISGYSGDVDLFLYSGSSLLGKSVKSSGADDEMEFVSWRGGSGEMMEIRVYGNTTDDYSGHVYFNPLFAANASDESQKYNDTNPIDFGTLDPNQTSATVNVKINNTDNQAADNVIESAEIYHVDSWTGQSQPGGTYRFFVPDFAEKVKVKVEWTGGTRYNLFLRKANNALVGNSSRKYYNANISDSLQEEFLTTTSISASNDGYWNITVFNTSKIVGDYNVTAYIWMPAGSWFESSYPSGGFDFTAAGSANQSKSFSFNITVPQENLINGTYQGFLRYNNSEGWKMHVPLQFRVKAGMLFMNNDNVSASTYPYTDNVGFNRLGANSVPLNITYNNTGDYPIYYTQTNSNNKLYRSGNPSNYIDFVVDSLPGTGSMIENGTSGTLDLRLIINSSKTGDNTGTYIGNITFNTTNATASSSSYPFKTYVLTISVALNLDLTLNLTGVVPTTVQAPVNASNVTAKVRVKIANGSTISYSNQPPPYINLTDFTGMRITNVNVSNYYDLYNNSKAQAGGLCTGGICYVNWTMEAGVVGGMYNARVTAQVNTTKLPNGNGKKVLSGTYTTPGSVIEINDVGLHIGPKTVAIINEGNPLDEGDSAYFTVYVRNYGPVGASNFKLDFNNPNSCEVSITPVTTNSTCMGTSQTNSSGTTWTVTSIPAYMGEPNCSLTWRVTANSVTEDQGWCNMNVDIESNHNNFGALVVSVEVHDNATSGGDDTSGDGQQQTSDTCSDDDDCDDDEVCSSGSCSSISCSNGYVKNHKCYSYENEYSFTSYTEKIYVLQGSSNSTKATVKNNGAYTRTTKLNVIMDVDGVTGEVIPTSYSLAAGNSGVFTVEFNVSGTADVGYHQVKLKAYVSQNESISKTQQIILAVQPTEETKLKINQTYDELKGLFESLAALFTGIVPSSSANYTLANRTYNRLLGILEEIQESIGLEKYLEANTLLKDANASLAEFQQQISQITGQGLLPALGGDVMTWVIILVVIVVIGGFMIYLLLPPKKGYHHMLGYVPKEKISIVRRLKHIFAGLGKIKGKGKKRPEGQHTLEEYEHKVDISERPETPPQVLEKKPYAEGYEKQRQFDMAYKKKEMKSKKKVLGK